MKRNYYFTSDLHLNHRSIIKHCNRPFTSVLADDVLDIVQRTWFTNTTSYSEIAAELNIPVQEIEQIVDVATKEMQLAMNQTIIDNWNKTVKANDIIYVLGDVTFDKDPVRAIATLSQLKGEKHIIWGNHDYLLRKMDWRKVFKSDSDLKTITVPQECNNGVPQKIVLCHYALRTWDCSHYGSYHLYGHSHQMLADDPNMMSMDVGVDGWDFTPVSMEQINEFMSKKIKNDTKPTY